MNYDPNNILNSEETNFVKLSVYQSLEAENARLKAEVERLTKAGDKMADSINGDYNYSLPCVEAWHAAKQNPPRA